MDTSDYQKIRQLFDDYLQMYSSRDDRLTTYFSDDFSGFTGGGDFLVKDREEWVAITRQDFAQVKDPIHIELKDMAIQSLADTIAVATGFFTIHLPIEDHILSRETARLVLIFRKESVGWKISHSSISIPYYLVRDGEIYPLKELVERNQALEEMIVERTIQLSEANDNLQTINEELVREIEERKRTEEALKESEFFFKESQRSASIGSYKTEFITGFWESSEVLDNIFGIDKNYTRSVQGWLDIVHPDDRDTLDQYLRKEVITERKHFSKEYRIIRKNDGETRWVYGLGEPKFDCSGNILSLIGTIQDITERKLVELNLAQALAEAQRFREAMDHFPAYVFMKDPDFRYVYANQPTLELFGCSAEELPGSCDSRFFPTSTAQRLREVDTRALAGEHTAEEIEVVHADGSRRVYWEVKTPIYADKERSLIWGICGISTDITERKEHENEQLKIDKLESLGILAGGIAHDFNNILTGIKGNISFAQMFLDATHKSYKPLLEAEKATVRAGELAHQLLTFARGGEPVKKVVSIKHLAHETVSLALHGSNVKGCIDIPDSIHAIEADEGQLSQVFHNIIINATQAMPGGGTLTVTAQNEMLTDKTAQTLPQGSYIRLTFVDQGCGIPDDDLKRIFDPYFTTKSAGNGLGLSSANSIVNRHGGHIGVSSETGKGTTFTIYLPSIGESYPEYQSDTATQTAGYHTGGSILVMDDDEMIRDMTTEMLGFLGYQVTTCETGAEAITQYKAGKESGAPFSAVIMDLTIPGGMGGKEAAKHVLAIDPKACLIVSSGYSNDPIMSDYRAYGFNGAVEKPYNINELGQLLSSLLFTP